MKPLLAFILVGAAIMVMFMPMVAPSLDTEPVSIYETPGGVLLVGNSGQMEVALTPEEKLGTYSSDNLHDFTAELMDSGSITRLEILPYGTGTICNVQANMGRSVAGKTSFCVALAMRSDITLHVHEDLLLLDTTVPQGLGG